MRYIGIFDKEDFFTKAVQQLQDAEIAIEEIYSPIPVHHAVKSVAGSSRLPIFAYFFGLIAILLIIAFLYYAAVLSWPMNIGGKPSNAFPSFLIVTLVLTILSVTLASLLAFSIKARLYPGKKIITYSDKATDNKFIIVLKHGSLAQAENILKENGATEIIKHEEL